MIDSEVPLAAKKDSRVSTGIDQLLGGISIQWLPKSVVRRAMKCLLLFVSWEVRPLEVGLLYLCLLLIGSWVDVEF